MLPYISKALLWVSSKRNIEKSARLPTSLCIDAPKTCAKFQFGGNKAAALPRHEAERA